MKKNLTLLWPASPAHPNMFWQSKAMNGLALACGGAPTPIRHRFVQLFQFPQPPQLLQLRRQRELPWLIQSAMVTLLVYRGCINYAPLEKRNSSAGRIIVLGLQA